MVTGVERQWVAARGRRGLPGSDAAADRQREELVGTDAHGKLEESRGGG